MKAVRVDLHPLPRPELPAALTHTCTEIERHAAAVKLQFRNQGMKLVEKDYHDTLTDRLSRHGFEVNPYFSLPVPGTNTRQMDILVNGTVIIEVKKENWENTACRWRNYIQGYHYCIAGEHPLCMVINFASTSPEVMWVAPNAEVSLTS